MDIEALLTQILNSISKVQSEIHESLRSFANLQSRISKTEEAVDNLKANISEIKHTNQRQNDEMKSFGDIRQQIAVMQNDINTIKNNLASNTSKWWDFVKILLQHFIWALVYGGLAYLFITLKGTAL